MKNDLRILIFKVFMSWHFNVSYWIDLMNLQPCALGFFFRGHWCMTYLGILRPREKLFKKSRLNLFHPLKLRFLSAHLLYLEPQGQPFINGWKFGDFQPFLYVKIWFIIQLKHPFINGCLGFQVLATAQFPSRWKTGKWAFLKNWKMGIFSMVESKR